jgi:CRP-like cAMP-binding protein
MRRFKLPVGEYVYREEDPSEALYLIRSGKIDITVTYPETGEAVDATHGPGRIFGEVELIDQRSRTSSAKVSEQAQLIAFDRDELLDILFNSPEKSLLFGKTTYQRLKELFSDESLDSELARLREEMKQTIQQAVVSHESRVVRSHSGMLAIAVPVILMVVLAVGAYWFFHRA